MSTLTLMIRLDHEHMRSGDDVQRALALTGAELANRYDGLTLPTGIGAPIHDNTGKRVGAWSIEN